MNLSRNAVFYLSLIGLQFFLTQWGDIIKHSPQLKVRIHQSVNSSIIYFKLSAIVCFLSAVQIEKSELMPYLQINHTFDLIINKK